MVALIGAMPFVAAASLLGGWLAEVLPRQVQMLGLSLQRLQVLFVLSAAGRFLAARLAQGLRGERLSAAEPAASA